MRIAILGTRGIPASYGGFETFAEHLATRLVARGHEVTVYSRAHYVSPRQLEYHGVRIKVLPTIRHKYFDTVVHTFLSAVHAVSRPFRRCLDLQLSKCAVQSDSSIHRNAGGDQCRRSRTQAEEVGRTGTPLLSTRRISFDDVAERSGNRCAGHPGLLPGSLQRAVDDDRVRQRSRTAAGSGRVRKWRVEPNRYVLYVSRLEPENNAHLVIEAFKKVRTAYRLLIVGDAPYAESYINNLKAQARGDKRIVFTGFRFWSGLSRSPAKRLLLRSRDRSRWNTSGAA